MRILVALCWLLLADGARAEDWASVRTPSPGPPHSIGAYSAGCIEGARALALRGEGFRVARPRRGRVFGHPALVDVLQHLGHLLVEKKLGLLWLGDLGQPRGGPQPTGHASHQTGLDADVYYAVIPQSSTPRAMVNLATNRVTKYFSSGVERLLTLAAADSRVERIFVHPALKRRLCTDATGDREWLHKIRPWWGHHDHFHLRLACPEDSPDCKAQDPLPQDDGCAEVAWWLSPEATEERAREKKKYKDKIGSKPALPSKCADLLIGDVRPRQGR